MCLIKPVKPKGLGFQNPLKKVRANITTHRLMRGSVP